ncbi:hypothetical protein KIPB_014948, partial [Kipferlia bialata]
RDMHDTFFISPEGPSAGTTEIEPDYEERVRSMHEKGGMGSRGWRYEWSGEEARRNILRTHTTAASSRVLAQLAKEWIAGGKGPLPERKFFSVDRVFRNETLDATHLAEFHQVQNT